MMNEKLDKIYREIEGLSDEIPAQLSRKITLYSQTLLIIGRYHAQAVRDHGLAYANRKRVWGETILNTEGTSKDKEAAAEVESFKARQKEAEAEMEVWRWKNAFQSHQEIIQALKIEQKTLMKEYDGVG